MDDKTKFKVGDRVFAKIRGHPYWPALIQNVESKHKLPKYSVLFYGTKETASVKELDICLYLENKTRFGVSKVKNKKFENAMKEMDTSFNRSPKLNQHLLTSVNNISLSTNDTTPSEVYVLDV